MHDPKYDMCYFLPFRLVHRIMKVTLTMAVKNNIIITIIPKLVSGN